MNARTAKIIRQLRAALDPRSEIPGLEKALQANWLSWDKDKRASMRKHMRRVIRLAKARPEDLARMLGPGGAAGFFGIARPRSAGEPARKELAP